MMRGILVGLAASLVFLPWSAQAQTVTENQIIAPLAGRMYTPSSFRSPADFYGVDAFGNPSCTTAGHCVHHEAANSATRFGFLYGANIIDVWTVDQSTPGHRAVDLYWNVSTWDPYQVLLMRSRLEM